MSTNIRKVIGDLRCIVENTALFYQKTSYLDCVRLIKDRAFTHMDGTPCDRPFREYLVSSSGNVIYPIIDDVLYALTDCILVRPCLVEPNYKPRFSKSIQSFYDNKGWQIDQSQQYEDAVRYEDTRSVSEAYIRASRTKVNEYLDGQGKYLLDAASGPLQFDEYMGYSKDFNYRICVDISISALLQAKHKLKGKGIYLLASVENLPIQNGKIDNIVSLNTVYHIPKMAQQTAFKELYRVLKPKGKAVVVYSWGRHSWLMRLFTLPRVLWKKLKQLVAYLLNSERRQVVVSDIYFYAHKRRFFKESRLGFPVHIHSWRLLSVPFMKYYVHDWLFGSQFLKFVNYLENKFPIATGRLGEYPLIHFSK